MKRRPQDPYRAVIQRFNRRGVRYVVVGMAGINYYAKNAGEMFATLDYDIFLDPSLQNVQKAIKAVQDLDFNVAVREGSFQPADLETVVRERRTLVATTPEGFMVELLLKISGYPFWELAKDQATFSVSGVPVRVGRLSKLIRSKRLAGRPKDRDFLRRYQALLEEDED